jgi:hypothetical protein
MSSAYDCPCSRLLMKWGNVLPNDTSASAVNYLQQNTWHIFISKPMIWRLLQKRTCKDGLCFNLKTCLSIDKVFKNRMTPQERIQDFYRDRSNSKKLRHVARNTRRRFKMATVVKIDKIMAIMFHFPLLELYVLHVRHLIQVGRERGGGTSFGWCGWLLLSGIGPFMLFSCRICRTQYSD